ncbi:MAG: rubrerythrin family protein [Candidatus Eremiobacteraeota bacterium]|nr:rubrerythrin family protein [Candidatus Eremiobacteraeota bacterium]
MKKIAEQKVREALASECLDHMRYLIFAEKAKEEGYHNIARLFQTIAYAERIHARKYLLTLQDVGTTKENLLSSLAEEKFQSEELYPALFEIAGFFKEVEAQIGFHGAQQSEQVHTALFQKALETIEAQKDIILGEIHICRNCGFSLEGSPPPTCPVCGMAKEKFKQF